MLIDINGDSLPDRVFDRNPANDQQGFYVYLNTGHGISIEYSPLLWVGRFFQFLLPPKSDCHCLPLSKVGFNNGKQWQTNLGGNKNWKNRLTHSNGEYYMLIDIDHWLDFCQTLDQVSRRHLYQSA
jgi:hypothetical protein